MEFDVKNIFIPSVGVNLVFNINTDLPTSNSSIIYDADYEKQSITIAQPTPPVMPSTPFEQLHLTTLVYIKQRRLRIGIPCSPARFINNYPMADGSPVSAIMLEYRLPATETNIRAAFRLSMTGRYTVKAKIVYNAQEYRTPGDFKIKDISFSGLGIVILEKKEKRLHPLATLKTGTKMIMGLALVDRDQPGTMATFPIQIQVARIKTNYSETHTLIGFKITNITPKDEEALNQFIHVAQIEELKRISKKG
jgi:hypothetical protein